MPGVQDQLQVVVAGDVTTDWNIAQVASRDRAGDAWSARRFARACAQPGGASLIADLLALITPAVFAPSRDGGATHQSYVVWTEQHDKPGQHAWRVKEFLGVDPANSSVESRPADAAGDPERADIVVLSDAALGFRDDPARWPRALRNDGHRPWVIVSASHPVARGPLWDHLVSVHRQRLVAVLPVDALRQLDLQIRRAVSWEAAAQDIHWEIRNSTAAGSLGAAAHLVVSLGLSGAFVQSPAAPESATLVFDPRSAEGEWSEHRPGGMVGVQSCMTAAIVREVILRPASPDFVSGARAGLAAGRALHAGGYDAAADAAGRVDLRFPHARVTGAIAATDRTFAAVSVAGDDAPGPSSAPWSILDERHASRLDELARTIAVDGLDAALGDVPLGRFGALVTADRLEFVSLGSVRALIAEYCGAPQKRPLSIAVFGPPGSGKSFAVEQVAASAQPGKIKALSFNLSQFGQPAELLGAFHQVRDIGLSGAVPLVFWDEFDTSLSGAPLGWLRYFLAPMQDGVFQEGQLTHPIGRAIFIFAGGTSARLASFPSSVPADVFRGAKGPDFVSRLKGHLDMLGPNRQMLADPHASTADPHYIIRRAILLRAMLRQRAPQLFETRDGRETLAVDAGVLRAFMGAREYRHGARSLEAVIAMSRLSGLARFERSALPSEEQLDMHVNGVEFLALVRQPDLDGELLERLSAAAHEVFCEGKQRDGWQFGAERSESLKTHPLLVPYEQLPEDYKDANRVTVRALPRKLAAAGCVMMPARRGVRPAAFTTDELEMLARLEHDIWMEAKLASGWSLGKPGDGLKRSEYLVPWADVPEAIREADRDLVRGMAAIISRAGYAIVRVGEATA
jgi:hypothetical protein